MGRRLLGLLSRGAPDARRPALAATALSVVALAGGCGGGTRQDHGEPSGTFAMEVVHASFPAKQTIARPTSLELVVRNAGSRTVPTVAVSLDSLSYTERHPELAANQRPVWVIERGPGAIAKPPVQTQEVSVPGGAQTAYVRTWALGSLAAGATETFRWLLTPVKPGLHTVHYTIAAGLAGRAKAASPSGGPVAGHFDVSVAGAPPTTHVNPSTGRIELGSAPATP